MDNSIPDTAWAGYGAPHVDEDELFFADEDEEFANDGPAEDDEAVVPAAATAPQPATPRPAVKPRPTDPTPATQVQTTPASQPAEAPAEDTVSNGVDVKAVERARQEAFYLRRRRRYMAIAAVVVVGLAWWLGRNVFTHSLQPTAAPAVHTDVDPAHAAAPAAVTDDLAKATQVLAADGNVTGINLPGARVASNGTTMYASRVVDGTCWAYGIIDGKPTDAQVDPAGTSCTDAAIAATQQRIDAVAGDQANVSRAEATAALQNAASLVGWYGSHNMVGGVPNLAGLVMPDNTVTASENTGDHVRLTTTVGGTCLTTVVTAAGSSALPKPCH